MAVFKYFTGRLYDRMSDDLHLAGMSDRTHGSYLRAVRQLAEYCQTIPDAITEDQLRRFFLHLKNERHFASGSMRVAFSGIKFFYTRTAWSAAWLPEGAIRRLDERQQSPSARSCPVARLAPARLDVLARQWTCSAVRAHDPRTDGGRCAYITLILGYPQIDRGSHHYDSHHSGNSVVS